jgi:hypothetical protein
MRMVDPLSVAAIGAAGKALDSAAGEAGGLIKRVFGPAADEIGEALGRYTAKRVGNRLLAVDSKFGFPPAAATAEDRIVTVRVF